MATIGTIQPLWEQLPLIEKDAAPAAKTTREGVPVFSDVLSQALADVKQTDAEKNQADYLLATGQLDNPATRSIASAKALLSVQLMAELRNRALEAYNDITRMSI